MEFSIGWKIFIFLFFSLSLLSSQLMLTSPLQHVFLMDNPWNCDCHLRQFRWGRESIIRTTTSLPSPHLLSPQRLHHQEEPLALRRLLLRAGAVGGQDLGPAGLGWLRLQAGQLVRVRVGGGQAGQQRQSGVLSPGQPSPGRQMGQSRPDPGQLINSSSLQPARTEIYHFPQLRSRRNDLIQHWDNSNKRNEYFNIILFENFLFQNIILTVRQLSGLRRHRQDKQQPDDPERDSPWSGPLLLCGNQQGRHGGVQDQPRSGPGEAALQSVSPDEALQVNYWSEIIEEIIIILTILGAVIAFVFSLLIMKILATR